MTENGSGLGMPENVVIKESIRNFYSRAAEFPRLHCCD